MSTIINKKILMSGADYFSVEELNPYSHKESQPDIRLAIDEHAAIKRALEEAGVEVLQEKAPKDCQDGIYTANWALVHNDVAILSQLPNMRQAEQPYAKEQLKKLGKKVVEAPYLFSGQGDALPCGAYLFCGQTYRTDARMHDFLAEQTGLEVIGLQTIPQLSESGQVVTNAVTGLPNSYFYDIDLALAVLNDDLIAYCPDAFVPQSQEILRNLPIKQIHVSLEEAIEGFACNLVSTGETVIMSNKAPALEEQIKMHGLKTMTPNITELSKGGGYIRCTTLTI